MRLLLASILNAFLLFFTLLGLPFRLLRARRRARWVRFRLSGDPPYRPGPRKRWPWGRRPEKGTVTSLHVLRKQLSIACQDAKLRGVIFEVEDLHASPAKRDAIVELFATVRRAQKQVVVYAVTADTQTYEVLSAADRIVFAPAGQLWVIGYAAEATALAEGLEKIGIRAQFVRRGEHKTAPELFTRKDISDIQRQTLEAFLDERYSALVEQLSQGRRMAPEAAQAVIDRGPFSARRAKVEGLVDEVGSEVDLLQLLETAPAPKDEAAVRRAIVGFAEYERCRPWPTQRWRSFRRARTVGVVRISGMIVDGQGGQSPVGPKMAGARTIIKTLRKAAKDPLCSALVVHVESPGGSATGSELILEELRRVAEKKPVVTFFDRVAASGGYMIALGGREMWTTPHAVAGSIGVFAGKFDVSGLLSQFGIHRTVMTRGANAGFASSSRGFTESERRALEASIEETYQAFLEQVAKARQKRKEDIHLLGEGRIYSGRRALEVGLVDRLGGFEGACARALALAGQTDPQFEIKTFGEPRARLSLSGFLQTIGQAQVYALCLPSLTWSGTGGVFDTVWAQSDPKLPVV
jgi:protease IV